MLFISCISGFIITEDRASCLLLQRLLGVTRVWTELPFNLAEECLLHFSYDLTQLKFRHFESEVVAMH